MSSTDHTRVCSTEKDFDPLSNQSKQICLPIGHWVRLMGQIFRIMV